MKGIYQLAKKKIRIETLYEDTHSLCRDYQVEGAVDFVVEISQSDITYEREKSAREDEYEGRTVRYFRDGYLETLAVYRKIAEKMPEYDTFLFHGSAIAVDGAGYLFTAASGTGKSTHTRLWRELLGERATMINDDKPLLKVQTDGAVLIYGTPWDGKHRLSSNIAVPLKAICILERDTVNSIYEITKQEALPMLIQQAYRPHDPAALAKTMMLISQLQVPCYRLRCNMDIRAAELSFHTITVTND